MDCRGHHKIVVEAFADETAQAAPILVGVDRPKVVRAEKDYGDLGIELLQPAIDILEGPFGGLALSPVGATADCLRASRYARSREGPETAQPAGELASVGG